MSDRTWYALSGEGMIEVDGKERTFRTGDRVALPPGTVHRDPWNPSSAELHVRGTFEPVTNFVEKASLPLLAAAGRLRGYKSSYD